MEKVNVYDTANILEREIRQTDEYVRLKEAFKKMEEDEEASKLYASFRQNQQALNMKQMTGQEITEEDMTSFQEEMSKMNENEVIQTLVQEERKVNNLINELNNIIVSPISELYNL